jgi:hypothetical protein
MRRLNFLKVTATKEIGELEMPEQPSAIDTNFPINLQMTIGADAYSRFSPFVEVHFCAAVTKLGLRRMFSMNWTAAGPNLEAELFKKSEMIFDVSWKPKDETLEGEDTYDEPAFSGMGTEGSVTTFSQVRAFINDKGDMLPFCISFDNLESEARFLMAYTRDEDREALSKLVQDALKPSKSENKDQVKVCFWMAGSHGASSYNRDVDTYKTPNIIDNYNAEAKERMEFLAGYKPKKGGELLILSGLPGTGKTHALRAIMGEWRKWADFHYVVDPAVLFSGQNSGYLTEVLLGSRSGLSDSERKNRWRVVILEDVGELLKPDAMDRGNGGLAQLLNITDGLIGQGRKLVVVVTTNEEIKVLHPAVSRPGRCAFFHEFGKLSVCEAEAWLTKMKVDLPKDVKTCTIADLYAIYNSVSNFVKIKEPAPIGFMAPEKK